MISAKLLNGNIISRDADFSKYIETVSEPGVIKGLVVSATKVGIGMARVPVSRSNGENLFVLVISDSETSISGDGDVYINIPQEIIDNGEIANEDGTGIATIEVGTMPSKNALKLATISNGVVTDERNMLKKVSDLEPLISALDERTATLEEEIGEILDKGAIDHLEESGIVGEKYTLSDTLFHQLEPISSNCTLEQNVADVSANTEIHIQRIASGTENNQLNLKLKKVGAPTQNLIVEVRRGVKVDVSSNEAYWYGDEVITSSEIAYGNITTDFAEYTVTFPESFGANQGDLLDIVLYQNGKIVNDINYYVIACDSTQYSEAYSFVAVNGTTRVRSKLMPYCSSVGFAQSLLCKVKKTSNQEWTDSFSTSARYTVPRDTDYTLQTFNIDDYLMGDVNGDISVTITTGWNYGYIYNRILVNDVVIQSGVEQKTFSDIIVHPGDVIKLQTRQENQSSIVQSNVENTITLSYNITQEENDYYHDKQILYWKNYQSSISSRYSSTVVGSQLFKYPNLVIFGENISNTSGDPDLRIDGTSIGKLGATIPYIGEITAGENHSIDIYNGWSSSNTIKVSKFNIFTYKYKIPSPENNVDGPIARILYPQKINTIGETTQVLIYGKLGDDYITDFDFNLVTSVQTGNITLGNAIGFIQLKYRGITYKIPVYG